MKRKEEKERKEVLSISIIVSISIDDIDIVSREEKMLIDQWIVSLRERDVQALIRMPYLSEFW
jgi:hypothetical protein